MKSLYETLQRFAFEIAIFFGISPYMPTWLQRAYKEDYSISVMYCWGLLAISTFIFTLCFWWLKDSWVVHSPIKMTMTTFGSVLGLLISSTALLGIYGYGTGMYLVVRDIPATVLIAMIIVSYAMHALQPKQ